LSVIKTVHAIVVTPFRNGALRFSEPALPRPDAPGEANSALYLFPHFLAAFCQLAKAT
jgi:hypothetical protein